MKNVLLVVIIGFLFAGCRGINGSGKIVKESRQTKNFNGVSVNESIDVIVRIGNTQSLEVEADDNLMEYVETIVNDGILEIGMADNNSFNDGNIKVYITVPYLDYLKASSSSSITTIDKITFDGTVKIFAGSSAEIDADLAVAGLTAEASSSSSINLKGSCNRADFSASSSADIDAFNLQCVIADASASSSGSINVNVTGKLKASASSSGDISYKGTSNVEKTETSSGSVDEQ